MLRAEDNKFLTELGRGTGMGELLRRFWIPVALSKELPEPDGEPKKVIVLGEELPLRQGEPPPQAAHQDRYAVRSGACVTNKAKDLPAVMLERFGGIAGFVGRPRTAAAE
jgi:hypothetical protein